MRCEQLSCTRDQPSHPILSGVANAPRRYWGRLTAAISTSAVGPGAYQSAWNRQDTWTNNRWTEATIFGNSFIAAVDTATFQRNPKYTPSYPWGRVLAIVETLVTSTLFGFFLLAIRRQFRR